MNKNLSYAFGAVASLALVLDIVALATTGWVGNGYGLFRICGSAGGLFGPDRICFNYGPVGTGGKVAAAFLILTVFLLTGAIVLAALGLKGKEDLASKAWILCAVAAVFVLIAIATYNYNGMPNDMGADSPAGFGMKLGYSYGLACAVGGLCIVSAALGFKII